jgi:hypothetical protein
MEQKPRNKHMQRWSIDLWQDQKQINNGERIVSSITAIGILHQQNLNLCIYKKETGLGMVVHICNASYSER